MNLNCLAAYLFMSDKANLLDIEKTRRVGRFKYYFLEISAVLK